MLVSIWIQVHLKQNTKLQQYVCKYAFVQTAVRSKQTKGWNSQTRLMLRLFFYQRQRAEVDFLCNNITWVLNLSAGYAELKLIPNTEWLSTNKFDWWSMVPFAYEISCFRYKWLAQAFSLRVSLKQTIKRIWSFFFNMKKKLCFGYRLSIVKIVRPIFFLFQNMCSYFSLLIVSWFLNNVIIDYWLYIQNIAFTILFVCGRLFLRVKYCVMLTLPTHI